MNWEHNHPELSKLRVLVIDDEQVLRTMIVYSLHAMGIKDIELAVNGEEALVKVKTLEDFHLIICDWMMPGMSGLEFLKKIKALKYRSKFLMLTGKSTSDAVSDAIAAGADSYLAKPYSIENLRKRLIHITRDIVLK